ncbi:hypothetical protein [Arthrobacter sp. 31Y]|uniref:hypothetical protein n=1 Tax=Arthrobacter sp. 31Y TaxID=1115632 RepID=UPI0004668860|nr:hypothetical protein [Arthrobacter sp. 31Y]
MTIITTGAVTLAADAHRQQTALGLAPTGAGLAVRSGVHTGLTVSKTAGMGFQVALGRAVIAASTGEGGAYVATVTEAENGSFDVGDASRDRIDIVALKVDEASATPNAVSVTVIKGAYPASGQPVPPVIPAAHIGLAQAKIIAGTSAGNGGWSPANLADIRPPIVLANQTPGIGGDVELIGIYVRKSGTTGAPYYRKSLSGEVKLSGVVGATSTSVTHIPGQKYPAFRVPAEVAPPIQRLIPTGTDLATGGSALLYVNPGGLVEYSTYGSAPTTSVGSNFFLTLDGVSW